MSMRFLRHPFLAIPFTSWALGPFGCLITSVHLAFGQSQSLLRFEYTAPAMGSHVDMVVYAENRSLAKLSIDAGIAEIERLTMVLSNYDSTSEISQLCSAPMQQEQRLSKDLALVLEECQRWHKLSDGCFDITVGPLTALWRASRKSKQLPSPAELRKAKQRCGWSSVVFDSKFSISLHKENMILDLSGIAVGYIVDRAFEKMVAAGPTVLLINAGGDVRVGDAPPGVDGWRVTVAGLGKNSPPLAKLRLSNCAITTSGDLNQYVEIDGRRYSHFIDPHTGEPIERRQSVTAIAKTTIDADAGATALAILGMERGAAVFRDLPLTEAILVESGESDAISIRLRHLSQTD